MKMYRRILNPLRELKLGDVLPEDSTFNYRGEPKSVKLSVENRPDYWELVVEIPNRGDYVEGCENEDWSGKIFRGEYLRYEEKCEKYPHLMLDENKEGITDVAVVRPAEKFEDGDVFIYSYNEEEWFNVFKNITDGVVHAYSEITPHDGYISYSEGGFYVTGIERKATEEDMQRLHDMGYEIVDKKFQKIQPKIVGDNGLEGEFREEWVESEITKTGYFKGCFYNFNTGKVINSITVSVDGFKSTSGFSPTFKTKKKLYLYLASLEDE